MARAVIVGILAAFLLAAGAGCSFLLDFGGDLAADAAPADAGPADAAPVADVATTDAGS
jgi:hypothetical protein